MRVVLPSIQQLGEPMIGRVAVVCGNDGLDRLKGGGGNDHLDGGGNLAI